MSSRCLMNRSPGRRTQRGPGRGRCTRSAALRPRLRRPRPRSAARLAGGTPRQPAVVRRLTLPVLFAAGEPARHDRGCPMNFAYGWAFAKPVRKVYYNITITGLSVEKLLKGPTLAGRDIRVGVHPPSLTHVAGDRGVLQCRRMKSSADVQFDSCKVRLVDPERVASVNARMPVRGRHRRYGRRVRPARRSPPAEVAGRAARRGAVRLRSRRGHRAERVRDLARAPAAARAPGGRRTAGRPDARSTAWTTRTSGCCVDLAVAHTEHTDAIHPERSDS